jgi:hypothetical protein
MSYSLNAELGHEVREAPPEINPVSALCMMNKPCTPKSNAIVNIVSLMN